MTKLTINSNIQVDGKYSVSKIKTDDGIIISGILSIKGHVENIVTVEDSKLFLIDVEIIETSIGSDEDMTIYRFTAKKIKFKGGFAIG